MPHDRRVRTCQAHLRGLDTVRDADECGALHGVHEVFGECRPRRRGGRHVGAHAPFSRREARPCGLQHDHQGACRPRQHRGGARCLRPDGEAGHSPGLRGAEHHPRRMLRSPGATRAGRAGVAEVDRAWVAPVRRHVLHRHQGPRDDRGLRGGARLVGKQVGIGLGCGDGVGCKCRAVDARAARFRAARPGLCPRWSWAAHRGRLRRHDEGRGQLSTSRARLSGERGEQRPDGPDLRVSGPGRAREDDSPRGNRGTARRSRGTPAPRAGRKQRGDGSGGPGVSTGDPPPLAT
mmetsp:Transcript_7593/g.21577  ORF Transcript_7593/g.21577 Transcript_7593/m.21577 type:complete len:292 (+) Transcript_7593:1544-2419(+)